MTLVMGLALTGPAAAQRPYDDRFDHRHFREYDMNHWRTGRWHQGWHDRRFGWWWIVGGIWYFYPAPVYPFPDPYRPPVVVAPAVPPPPGPRIYYFCDRPRGYYPYVPQCLVPWRAVPAGPP